MKAKICYYISKYTNENQTVILLILKLVATFISHSEIIAQICYVTSDNWEVRAINTKIISPNLNTAIT